MAKLLRRKNRKGLTLVEVMVIVLIMGLLFTIAVPNFARIRRNAYRDKCITNLQIIAAAKEHYSLETGCADSTVPTAAQLNPYIKGGTSSLACPLDSTETFANSYNINNIATNCACKKSASTHMLD